MSVGKYCPYCGETEESKFAFGALKCAACEDKHKRQAVAWVKSGGYSSVTHSAKQKKESIYDLDLAEEEEEEL